MVFQALNNGKCLIGVNDTRYRISLHSVCFFPRKTDLVEIKFISKPEPIDRVELLTEIHHDKGFAYWYSDIVYEHIKRAYRHQLANFMIDKMKEVYDTAMAPSVEVNGLNATISLSYINRFFNGDVNKFTDYLRKRLCSNQRAIMFLTGTVTERTESSHE